MTTLLVVDQGTTSVRASVVTDTLEVLAEASRPIERHHPAPGWVELDAEHLLAETEAVAKEAVQRSGVIPVGFAMANQGETVVGWERGTGMTAGPAIGWQCKRTEAWCEEIRDRETWLVSKTGLPVDPYFSASKLRWLLDEGGLRTGVQAGTHVLGTLDTFTLSRLSDGKLHITDPSTACRTQLLNLEAGQWDSELLAFFGVPAGALASVSPTAGQLGHVRIAGLSLPLVATVCDQPAALFGCGAIAPGMAKCTLGTGAFVQANVGASRSRKAFESGLLSSIAWQIGGDKTYLVEGSVLAAADVVAWLTTAGLLTSRIDVDQAYGQGSCCNVVCVPALSGLGTPRWRSNARMAFLGIEPATAANDMVRASLDGVAHLLVEVLESIEAGLPSGLQSLVVDGGLSRSTALTQKMADLWGRAVHVSDAPEATTRGAAALGWIGAGMAPEAAHAHLSRSSSARLPVLPPAEAAVQRQAFREAVDLVSAWAER